jgi:hypothetical protein
MITDCNVTMMDETSGVMGLGFPRLSSIGPSVTNCTSLRLYVFQALNLY